MKTNNYLKRIKTMEDRLAEAQSSVEWLKSGSGNPPPAVQKSDAFISQKSAVESAQSDVDYIKNSMAQMRQKQDFYKKQLEQLQAEEAAAKAGKAGDSGAGENAAVKDLKENEEKVSSAISYQKGLPGFDGCDLTPAELLALYVYTGNGYKTINRQIREGGAAGEKVKIFADVLNRALLKLQPYTGNVNRGADLPDDILAKHKVGEVVTYPAFTSSSIGEGFTANVKFVIKSASGRFVGPYSPNSDENEVLFPAGARFKVLDRKDHAGITEIIMEEVQEPAL